MSEYIRAKCPYCATLTPGTRDIEVSTEQRNRVMCSHCHKAYTIIFGRGKIRTEKWIL